MADRGGGKERRPRFVCLSIGSRDTVVDVCVREIAWRLSNLCAIRTETRGWTCVTSFQRLTRGWVELRAALGHGEVSLRLVSVATEVFVTTRIDIEDERLVTARHDDDRPRNGNDGVPRFCGFRFFSLVTGGSTGVMEYCAADFFCTTSQSSSCCLLSLGVFVCVRV